MDTIFRQFESLHKPATAAMKLFIIVTRLI